MKTFALVIPCILALLSMERCTQPAAVEPQPGDLVGEWRINLGRQRSFGQGSPLLAELRLRNLSENTVYLPTLITPEFQGQGPDETQWTLLKSWPRKLRSGDSAACLWSIESELSPGPHTVRLYGESASLLEVQPMEFTIENWQASELLRDYYYSLRGHYERGGGEILQRLKEQAERPDAPPSVHLQLAELMESAGNESGAREHYGIFAERTFGTGAIPGWLMAKLEEE